MNNRWHWIISQLAGRLWFWAGLYAVGGIASALAAVALAPLIPESVSIDVGASAVEDILTILASSMLAVATFSLSTMVAAFTASINSTTPRAAELLIEDRTAQNAIASFVGAFLYSLVGIIALRTGLYGASGRLVLFASTIIVVFTVVVMLLKWIDHLSRLGRLDEILNRVERAAREALALEFELLARNPEPMLDDGHPLRSPKVGYIQFTDLEKLAERASQASGRVRVTRRSGALVDTGDVLAITSWRPSADELRELQSCFVISANRSVEQDARYAMIMMTEIGCRALSPGVNDAGTAIDVLARIVRVLATCGEAGRQNGSRDRNTRVEVAPIAMSDLFDDVFTPLARDGAANLQVAIRLQKSLAMLARHQVYRREARRHAALALERARRVLPLPVDQEALCASAVLLNVAPDGGLEGRSDTQDSLGRPSA